MDRKIARTRLAGLKKKFRADNDHHLYLILFYSGGDIKIPSELTQVEQNYVKDLLEGKRCRDLAAERGVSKARIYQLKTQIIKKLPLDQAARLNLTAVFVSELMSLTQIKISPDELKKMISLTKLTRP
ncbi:MAG: hypothetical protein LBK52_03345 [Deltaproteobacteria bacterium]|nr:hypothetical protein [Deltaproteobacteria bacterium]